MMIVQTRRQLLQRLLLGPSAGIALYGEALAHEAKPAPKFGGHVLEAEEIFFEVVSKSDRTLIYVEDDGKPVDTRAMTGALTFQLDGRFSEVRLKSGGFNLLYAEMAKPPRGTPVSASVALTPADRVNFVYVAR